MIETLNEPIDMTKAEMDGAPVPRSRLSGWAVKTAWFLLLCLCIYRLQWSVELSRPTRTGADPLYLPNGKLLHVVSLGYDNVLADVLWLHSIQYVMQEFWGTKKYAWLRHIFDLITELDPRFEAAYVQGAMFLGMMQGKPAEAIDLLEKGKKNNPSHWVYPAEQSFYAALHLRDRKRAVAYINEALALPDAPPALLSRLANLYRTMGKQELALRQWQQVEKTTTDPKFRQVAQANLEYLLRGLEKQYPRVALFRWREIESTNNDPGFVFRARENIARIEAKLKQLPANQHGPEQLPESDPNDATAPR